MTVLSLGCWTESSTRVNFVQKVEVFDEATVLDISPSILVGLGGGGI